MDFSPWRGIFQGFRNICSLSRLITASHFPLRRTSILLSAQLSLTSVHCLGTGTGIRVPVQEWDSRLKMCGLDKLEGK